MRLSKIIPFILGAILFGFSIPAASIEMTPELGEMPKMAELRIPAICARTEIIHEMLRIQHEAHPSAQSVVSDNGDTLQFWLPRDHSIVHVVATNANGVSCLLTHGLNHINGQPVKPGGNTI